MSLRRYIAIFGIFMMTASAAVIFDFQEFEMLTVSPLYGADMHHHAKFHQNRSHRYCGNNTSIVESSYNDDSTVFTGSSAITEKPRDAPCQLRSCQLPSMQQCRNYSELQVLKLVSIIYKRAQWSAKGESQAWRKR